jgi:hypothetical protein
VFSLNSDDLALGPDQFGSPGETVQEPISLAIHDTLVFGQQRFALRPIDDYDIAFGTQFHIGGKATATSPHDSGGADLGKGILNLCSFGHGWQSVAGENPFAIREEKL